MELNIILADGYSEKTQLFDLTVGLCTNIFKVIEKSLYITSDCKTLLTVTDFPVDRCIESSVRSKYNCI